MGVYAKYLEKLSKDYEDKINPKVEEIELDEVEINPLDTLLTSSQLWLDGYDLVKLNEFYALSIVGPQGSGKSSIALQIANYGVKNGFKLIYALPDDYLNDINAWLDLCTVNPRTKIMIVLDDLSYSTDAQGKKTQALLKNMVARVRHIFKGQIFMIYITHRLHATPPMLRNSASWIFTNMQSADRDDALEIIGRNKELRERLESIYTFIARVTLEGAKNRIVKYFFRDKEYSFRWGDKYDKGDGRLMASFHGGKLGLFLSKDSNESINFEDYRFIPIPKVFVDGPKSTTSMRKKRDM